MSAKTELLPLEKLLTRHEVCEMLQISQSLFYRLKELPKFKVGGTWRVRPSDLRRYLSEQREGVLR